MYIVITAEFVQIIGNLFMLCNNCCNSYVLQMNNIGVYNILGERPARIAYQTQANLLCGLVLLAPASTSITLATTKYIALKK